MVEQKNPNETKQSDVPISDGDTVRKIERIKLQFWLGLGGIILIGLGIAVYFIFLKNPLS